MFVVSRRWRNLYPEASVGVLVARVAANVEDHPALEQRKRSLEAEVRGRFSDPGGVKLSGSVPAYSAYYKRFDKTYHLVQQFKSVAGKGKPLPTVSGLVDVMFMAEMKNLLLTAGHDLAAVMPPVTLDAGTGVEMYVKLNQEPQVAKADDMVMADGEGVISSVINGPDFRTRITPATKAVLYVVYAPEGVPRTDVCSHLQDIRDLIRTFSADAEFEPITLLSCRGIEQKSL